jgi:hypothetical protein
MGSYLVEELAKPDVFVDPFGNGFCVIAGDD